MVERGVIPPGSSAKYVIDRSILSLIGDQTPSPGAVAVLKRPFVCQESADGPRCNIALPFEMVGGGGHGMMNDGSSRNLELPAIG